MGNSDQNGQVPKYCTQCQQAMTFVSQYKRWYCYNCRTYGNGEDEAGPDDSEVVPEESDFSCSTCGQPLFYIKNYDSHFCYRCNAYQQPDTSTAPLTTPGGEVSEVPGYSEPQVEEPTCPDCGVEIDDDWIRCPNCGSALNGQMTEEPVTTPDERPDDGLYQDRPHLDEEDMPEPASASASSSRDDVWDGRHEGQYKWEPDAEEERDSRESTADEEAHDWKSSAKEETAEREQSAAEVRDDREESASEETDEWRRDAHEEREEWDADAAMQKLEREMDAELERQEWDEANEPSAPGTVKVEVPDEHRGPIDQEVEFLVEMFQEILTEFLKEPMEPISFYRSKLNVLCKKCGAVRKVKVDPKGGTTIFVEMNDFDEVLDGLTTIFDNLIMTEAKITSKPRAMARAKEILEPIIEEYEEELDDLGIIHKILKGAFATRLPSGVPGFDEMLHGGVPNGASIIVQGATGGEKEMFANQFLAEGLRSEGTIMVAVSMISPSEWRTQMKSLKAKTRRYEKEGQIIVVDWYTHKNERVRSVERRDSVILSSKSITNLEIAIDKAIKVIRDAPTKRAVIAILSPAIKALGFDKVYGFAQSIRGKFKKYGITGLFLLEKKMHDERVVSSLHTVFDGIFDIERQRVGDSLVRKIGVLSLKGATFESRYRELKLTRNGLMVMKE